MKNNPKLKKILLLVFLIFNFSLIESIGQSCDQLEIIFTEPECFKPKEGSAVGNGDSRSCKTVSACINSPYQYTSSITGVGYTYNWNATGPSAVIFSPSNAVAQVTIVWPVIGTYTLTLTVQDGMGNTFTKCLNVDVKEKPVANFTFAPNNVCAGSTISFNSTSTYSGGGMIYSWNFGDPTSLSNYSTNPSPTHTFNNFGVYNVTLIVSSFSTVLVPPKPGSTNEKEQFEQKVCCSDTIIQQVTIVPGTLKIECVSTVCANTLETYTAVGCSSPIVWGTPIGGTTISSTIDKITIQWGNGAVQGQIIAACPGGCTTYVPVPIIPVTPIPVGKLFPCASATESYTLPVLPGTFYRWQLRELPSGTVFTPFTNPSSIYTLPDNNTVWINWNNITGGFANPANSYQLTIDLLNNHICCGPITNSITIIPRGTFKAFSDQTICLGSAASLNAAPSIGTFNWSVLPTLGVSPVSGTGPSFNPSFTSAGSYNVTLNEIGNNYCNTTDNVKITVLPATPAPGTITGPANACINDILTYSMSTVAPAGYHYTWTITGGAGTFQPGALTSVTGNNANIVWTTLSGTISVVLERNDNPSCPSPIVTKNVTIATTGVISGTPNVCVDSNGFYSLTGGTIPPGTTVTWSILPAGIGTITAGQGSANVVIKWHGGVGAGPWTVASINAVTTCGAATPLTGVTIYPKFTFTMAQSSDICQPAGVLLSTSTIANFPTYLWSNGATTPTTSVFTAGTHAVTVTNAGGCTFTNDINVKDPFEIETTCSLGICRGVNMEELLTVSIKKPASGTFTYQWFSGTHPGGTSVQGPVTNATLINTYLATAAGNYYVEVTYGTCVRRIAFKVEQVCCPDVNRPQITSVVQVNCFKFNFAGTTPNPNGLPVTWYFGDGATASGLTATHTYTTAGIYCVKMCVGLVPTSGCGINCTATTVVVPIKAQFIPKLSCNGKISINDISINYAPANVTYLWDFGDGFTSTSIVPPAHNYAAGAWNLSLTLTYTNAPVSCSDTYTLPINYVPININVVPLNVCTDTQATFSSLSGSSVITFYNWGFGDGNFAFTSPTSHIYATSGLKNVTLSVLDNTGTTCTAATTVNVLPGISASLQPGYICPGSSALLTPTIVGTPTGYVWQEFVAGNWVAASGTNTSATYSVTSPGIYRVIVTASNGCVGTSNQVPVIAVPNPVAKIEVSPSKKLCFPGGFVTLNSVNHLAGYTSQWYLGSVSLANLIGTGQFIGTSVSSTNNFILVLTNEYGCQNTCQIVIEVNPLPVLASISPAAPVCEGVPTVLSIPVTSNTILWNTGQITNSITVYTAGVYTVTVTNPITGCSSSTFKTVNKRPPVDLFPHFCQNVSCTCTVPFTIFGPKPIVGLFAPSPAYVIDWFNASNVNIFTGQNLTPAATGTYYVKITDPSTGCINTSEKYDIKVPTAAECLNCTCEGGTWGDITLEITKPVVSTVLVKCNSVETVKCVTPYILNATYNCLPTGCDSQVAYSITDPAGNTTSGFLPYMFTLPITGNYIVVLTPICGGKRCEPCRFTFSACPALEVNLVRFTGKKVENKVALEWETASEKSNDYYILERGNDGQKFEFLNKTMSKNSNSSEKLVYDYIDQFPLADDNYYRLKAIDLQGKASYSQIIYVNFDEEKQPKIYPNPTRNDNVTLDLSLEIEGKLKLDWYDVLGRQIKSDNLIGIKGLNKIPLNVSDMAAGKYIIRIDTPNNKEKVVFVNFEKL